MTIVDLASIPLNTVPPAAEASESMDATQSKSAWDLSPSEEPTQKKKTVDPKKKSSRKKSNQSMNASDPLEPLKITVEKQSYPAKVFQSRSLSRLSIHPHDQKM